MRIAVIGDHCLDIDYIGEYDGLMSREVEKLPIFNCSSVRYSGGGAANIVELLRGLGSEVIPVGIWDTIMDTYSRILCNIFSEKNINTEFMLNRELPTPSFQKYYMQSGIHVYRSNTKSKPMFPNAEWELAERIGKLNVDAIIVADYDETGNGIITKEIREAINKRFPYACQTLKVGSSRTLPENLLWCDYLFMNEKENAGLHATGTKYVVTMGKSGAMIEYEDYDEGLTREFAWILEGKQLTKDIDICGCGDSFLSTFVIKKLEGLSDLECLQWSNAAGRAQARKLYGAHTLTWHEIGMEYTGLYGMTTA